MVPLGGTCISPGVGIPIALLCLSVSYWRRERQGAEAMGSMLWAVAIVIGLLIGFTLISLPANGEEE